VWADPAGHRPGVTVVGEDRVVSATRVPLEELAATIVDLTLIRESLMEALNAGCDDLMACTATASCPSLFSASADDLGQVAPSRS
jgi:hypothetical protein